MRALLLALGVPVLAAACSPYAPALPATPFLCGSAAPQCPDGFDCVTDTAGKMVCQDPAGGGPTVDAGSGSSSPDCSEDSSIEPNEDIAHATPTPVASSRNTILLGPLAICPAGDKDTFAFNVTVESQNADAIVTYDSGGSPVQVSIMGTGGQVLVNGVAAGNNMVKAHIANLPVANYFVQAFGPAQGGTKNTYTLSLAVTGP